MTANPALAQDAIPSTADFEVAITTGFGCVKASVGTIVAAVAAHGPYEIRKAVDLQRVLGIRSTLAWQVHRLTNAADLLAEAASVPGEAAMQRFFAAASGHGASDEDIQRARASLAEFERLVRSFAGDRTTFESMVSGLSKRGAGQVNANHQRAAFRANGHIWGAQARAYLACFIYQPSATDPDQIDAAVLRGLVDLQRLRDSLPWVITSTRAADDDGVVRRDVGAEPLDPDGVTAHGVCLMSRFCSESLPLLRSAPAAAGKTNVILESNGIGKSSTLTCIVGNVFRNFCARCGDPHNRKLDSHTTIRTPCEVLIQDVLVHEDIDGSMSPQALIYGDHRDVDSCIAGRECDRLSLQEEVVPLGKGPVGLHTASVPRYVEMVDQALEHLGWEGERFSVYRCRMEYPVMPSSVVASFALADTS